MSAYAKIEALAAEALEGSRDDGYDDKELIRMMAETFAEIEKLAHDAEHHGATT